MPVLPIINQGVKIGLKFTPAAPAQVVSGITTMSQVAMSAPAIQFIGPIPTPVLPVGAVASFALTQIEALLFKTYEILSKLIQQLVEQYQKQYKDAVQKRSEAVDKLYEDLLSAQEVIIEEVADLKSQISTLEQDIITLQAEQESQRIEYENTVFEYNENAKNAGAKGDLETRDEWLQKIAELDWWIADIILMIVEIVGKQLQIRQLKMELDQKQPLVDISVVKEWDTMVDIATDMVVAVPYRPDLPDLPSLPVLPPIPQIPELVKATAKAFAKWLTAPQVPPIGIAVSAIFAFLMSQIPNNPPPVSAQMEAQADAFLLQLGGCI